MAGGLIACMASVTAGGQERTTLLCEPRHTPDNAHNRVVRSWPRCGPPSLRGYIAWSLLLIILQFGVLYSESLTKTIMRTSSAAVLGIVLALDAAWRTSLAAATVAIPPSSLSATKSGNDLILSFSSVSPGLYTIQSSPDPGQQWTTIQSGIRGDGTVKKVTVTNALLDSKGFYRLLIQGPASLVLPQGDAFTILGHDCGGIKEQSHVTGFDSTSGNPTGVVYLSTTCSTGGIGSHPATYTAWASVTWDFTGNVVSYGVLSNSVTINPSFYATDAYSDTIYNANNAAYLVVPIPAAPTGVTAVQSNDQFNVSWTINGVNPAAVTSSTLIASPVNSSAAVLTNTIAGPVSTASIEPLQPQTTYQLTVVSRTIGGASPASPPISVTTSPATILPSAPTGVTNRWSNPDPTGTTDTLIANWNAAVPGNSPVDQYLVKIVGSDGSGTFTQTVSGTTLTAYFNVDYIPNWTVTVQAHNAAGWGPVSSPATLGGL
ncbi:MAG: hypothetical protein C5B50_29825 [Verrucomicrobia bacterium]|nr:MAG: hypothetical protein C5B50_29825 [Verrucomicrobiota bacterium]